MAGLLAMLLLGPPAGASGQAVAPADTTARAVDRLLDAWRGTESPGCVIGVARGGKTLYERGYGMADLEAGMPMRPGTIVHAASLAKQFTATAILQLARDGKLSLDDDVHRFVPELPDYGAKVTIRHLLTHTSGLRDYFETLILARGRFEEDRVTDADFQDFLRRQSKLNSPPGTQYIYSNTNYALAGLIVRRVSGQSLPDYATARIFGPLGMSHTSFRDDFATLVPGRAEGYSRRGTGWRSSIPNYDVPGATNLLTTVGDLLIWAKHLDHPGSADSALVAAMSTKAVLANGDSTEYGLGLSLVTDRGARVVEHEGRDPGFRAYLGRYVDHGLAVAVLCNAPVNPVGLGHDIAAVYLDSALRSPAPTPRPKPYALDSLESMRRVGVYFRPATLEVVELTWRDGALYSARTGGTKLEPLDTHRYQLGDRPMELTFGARANEGYRVRFTRGDRHDIDFEWHAPVTLTRDKALAYAGRYASEPLRSTYEVIAGDSTLTFRTGTSEGLVARQVFADTFVSGQITIQFVRRRGEIVAFEISHPRARRLEFVRE